MCIRPLLLGAAAGVLLLAACTGEDRVATFIHGLGVAVQELQAGQAVQMEAVNPARWSRLYVFAPYTPLAVIGAAIKTPLSADIERTGLQERDDINLLVFVDQHSVALVAAVPRNVVDFSVAGAGRPYDRHAAVFSYAVRDGRPLLVDR
ncbi:hypothetical protein ABWL39_02800 [Chitinivorax sp. PXF-14]|uniref:hypothetical protein n=1 Tax=Chitinivorax sp. PXF-14 TaxID=3230488 RepID=UPI003465E57A